MSARRRQILNRGISVLAAFVFISILGWTALALTSVQRQQPESMVAAAPVPIPTPAAKLSEAQIACNDAKNKAATNQSQNTSISGENVKDNCVAAVLTTPTADPKKPESYKCVGKTATVSVSPEAGTIEEKSVPNPNQPAGTCLTISCKPIFTSTTGQQRCSTAKLTGIDNNSVTAALNNGKTYTAEKDALSKLFDPITGRPMDQPTQTAIEQAFKDQQTNLDTKIDQTKKDVTDAQTQLLKLAACGEDPTNKECATSVQKAQEDLQKKQADLAALQKQKEELAAAQVALKPSCDSSKVGIANGGCTDPIVDPKQQCPAGTTGTPPNCTRVNTGCPGCTFTPDPNADRNRTGGTQNALSSFLSGLMNAFRPTPPAAPAPTPQACSTDPNAYAQQQQQYQQALQQYNFQLQQQQYQQYQSQQYGGGYNAPVAPLPAQPAACTPSTGNQCQNQPPQPPASACSGNWRAQYNGACITNWICDATNAPTATISCEPKVADVGMTLAITYSCSSGLATSSSFKVTTQPAGSATTTIKNPPAGTNTATYTLACTDNGKTAGDQCSIQVSRPSIILVANPKTVQSGGISLLSWLTSGMESCVISSPDQADFPARNAAYTSVNGAATSSAVTASTRFLLHCETVAGGIKDATTTVQVQ